MVGIFGAGVANNSPNVKTSPDNNDVIVALPDSVGDHPKQMANIAQNFHLPDIFR